MKSRSGFTLVELVVVVLVLGILAGVATGRFLDASEEARKNTLRTAVDSMVSAVEIRSAYKGRIATISPGWFSGNKYPEHPYNSYGVPPMQIANLPGVAHPVSAVLSDAALGAYWYNRANGTVRARVPWQGSRDATVELYSYVNNVAGGDAVEDAVGVAPPADTGPSI